MPTEANLTVDDLNAMSTTDLKAVMMKSEPIDLDALDDTMYLGIDVSLPVIVNKILWKTFRKTFHRDPETKELRGWNVRMEQTGWDKPGTPMTDRKGKQISFGHYRVRPAEGLKFPSGWTGAWEKSPPCLWRPVMSISGSAGWRVRGACWITGCWTPGRANGA